MNPNGMAEIGATTVSGSGAPRPPSAHESLVVAWLFPRAQAPTPLSWEGDDEKTIGRDPSCATELSGNDVSRRHAALRRSDAGSVVTLTDLGSRNGVRVN